MIKTIEQARAVQNHRFSKGLRGVSKAVRRFVKRGVLRYNELPNYGLPVRW